MHTELERTIKYFEKYKSNPKAVEKGLQIFSISNCKTQNEIIEDALKFYITA